MSFSTNVKDELLALELCGVPARRAELMALLHMTGSLRLTGGALKLIVNTDHSGVARRTLALVRSFYEVDAEILVMKKQRLNKHNSYSLELAGDCMEIMKSVGLLSPGATNPYRVVKTIDKRLIRSRQEKHAFLRGAFLGAGSLSNPERGYHLEFVTHSAELANGLQELLTGLDIKCRAIERKGAEVVYIKEGEAIVELLTMMGAHTALLNFENVRVYKQVRNDVNRALNCETANLDKTLSASFDQLSAIRYIEKVQGLEHLSDALREVAEVRLQSPEASLLELSVKLSNGLSKSGVNHRLRKLMEYATHLKQERGEEDVT